MYKILFSVIIIGAVSISCSRELPEVGGTSAQSIANEWWVELRQNNVDLYGRHLKIATYNTSANKDSIWVDDLGHVWDFKVKAKADYSNLTFGTTSSDNEYYPITVKITNGKVLVGAGRSKTGNVTDSIYMAVEFSDDPGVEYTISGHARTKFDEDEY